MRLIVPGILFGVSLTLGAAIAYEAVAPLDPVKVEPTFVPARHAAAAKPVSYAPPSVELFADIDARPLFGSTRKPLQDLTQSNGATAATSDFVLVGVILGGEHAVALLRNKSTSATMSATVGDLVSGWRVARIDATTVTLRANSGEFVIPLDGPANRPPSPALPTATAVEQAPAAISSPPPAQATPLPPRPVAASPAAQTAAVSTPAKPALPVRPQGGTIAPEALRSAPIDPSTGEPTL